MAHGFGAERTFGLEPFAERFAQAGLAAFVFDYRCFGDSEGQPRNLVSPRRHLQDWEAALSYVKGLTIPSWSVTKELKRLSNAQLLALNRTHFDPYQGRGFERAVTVEQDFLVRHLRC
jgi:hypothetical protein